MSKKYTDEFLIEELQRISTKIGRPPSGLAEYRYKYTAVDRFGSWEHTLRMAGLTLYATEDEGLEIRARYIREVKEIYRIWGRVPRCRDFEDIQTVKYYFRTLSGLLEASGMIKKPNGNWEIPKDFLTDAEAKNDHK
ncbi:hypothetical protein BMT55_01935 [Listeria newyorkensis]|uniref:Uncharacterized protein n=1 Tax=Listeria newyorkensis TaxID=1497681 RepID=A0ABX4XSF8_9LIST|nr:MULTISPECIES: hypothetical protein [Listeria]KGL46380.1 hypothetical protein EP56_01965 [Listeriaceae bacterium FSL A5-0209]KGL41820.1 hypothetical protein EP58_09745 [Listeria newyorkensis]PNP94271.1 hypothetical protein BMT55_01935 [Listeria newyorkensis]RQW67771.1 hypothetical protein DUK53_05495 [Listeria sp. SHR_NRA_18]WAO22685.1 hypothetical protein OTR81_05270 [Listeria newyorkensis]